MKKTLVVLLGIISIATIMAFTGGGGENTQSTSGAPSGYAGDPGGGNQTCKSCHTGPGLITISGVITSNIPPAGYTPSTTYTITANFVRAGHTKFGFEISPQSTSGVQKGILANITTNTQVVGTGIKYITHTTSGVTGSGSKTWNFKWTAPATGQGPVTFYGAFNYT